MFPDSGAQWPFWMSSPEKGPSQPTPASLGLSTELTAAVGEWVEYWRVHCEANLEWDTPAHRTHFAAEARAIRDRIARELGPDHEVVLVEGVY